MSITTGIWLIYCLLPSKETNWLSTQNNIYLPKRIFIIQSNIYNQKCHWWSELYVEVKPKLVEYQVFQMTQYWNQICHFWIETVYITTTSVIKDVTTSIHFYLIFFKALKHKYYTVCVALLLPVRKKSDDEGLLFFVPRYFNIKTICWVPPLKYRYLKISVTKGVVTQWKQMKPQIHL